MNNRMNSFDNKDSKQQIYQQIPQFNQNQTMMSASNLAAILSPANTSTVLISKLNSFCFSKILTFKNVFVQ